MARALTMVALVCVLSCAQLRTPDSPFDSRVLPERSAVQRALAAGRAFRPPEEIALMVSKDRAALRGVSLATGTTWNLNHRVDAFVITQDAVLILGDEELASVDLATGALRFRRSVGPLVMVGAAGGGDLTAVVLRTADTRRTDLLAINHRGSVLQQWETEERLGTPAVFGPMVWVPWRDTFVSALDPLSGTEVARASSDARVRDAYVFENSLWVGEMSFASLERGVRLPPLRGIAGVQDVPLLDAKPRSIAEKRVPFLYGALPRTGEMTETRDNTHYMVMSGVLVALRTNDREIRWLRKVDTEVIDAAPVEGGVVTCGKNGSVERVNSRGVSTTIVPKGEEIAQCLLHAHLPMPATQALEPSIEPYAQILDGDVEARLQRFALLQLGARGDERATQLLLEKALDPGFVAKHDASLREALTRVTGKQALRAFFQRDTLGVHVPIGTIALAYVQTGESTASIAELLLRPQTAERELPLLAKAVGLTNDRGALRDFFVLYRVGDRGESMTQALIESATAMLRLRSMSDDMLLRRAAADVETSAQVRAFLNEAFAKFPRSSGEGLFR
jgi:hypothetical protein